MFFIQQAQAQEQAQSAAPTGALGITPNILFFVVIVAVMWFLMIRPQQKRAKEHRSMIAALKKGDEVITNSGLMGRIIGLNDQAIELEIAKNTIVRFQRYFVAQVLPKGTLKSGLANKTEDASNAQSSDAANDE